MSIKSTTLPSVTRFGASNEFLVNGPSGTGRMTGATAAGFLDSYFVPENYGGVDLTVKFADEITTYGGDPWAWIKAHGRRTDCLRYCGHQYVSGMRKR